MKDGGKITARRRNRPKQLHQSMLEREQCDPVRDRVEEALRESEEKYRALVEQSLQGLVIAQGLPPRFVFINSAFADILGYTVEELRSLSTEEMKALVHPEDRAVFFQRYRARLLGKPVLPRYEVRAVRKDGTIRWVEIFSSRIEYDGKPAVQAAFVDITEHKRSNAALRESEAQSRAILDAIPDMMFRLNKDGTFLNYKAPKEMLYFPAEKFLGENVSAVLPPEVARQTMQFVSRALTSGEIQIFEYQLPIDGDIHHYEARLVACGADEVLAIVRDITEGKRANEALRGSAERYKTLADNLNVGVYRNTTGATGKFIEANPAIVKMFGFRNREEFLAVDVASLYQNPEDRRKFSEKMLRDGFVKNEELRLKRNDGTLIIGSVSAVAVRGEDGAVRYYDGIIEDITESKRTEVERKQNFEMLQRLLAEMVDVLASTVEMRDPYTAGHQRRVTVLACAIAEEMGLSEEQIEGIRLAARIHDIGKIYVPAEILSKPGRLTDTEFSLIKAHPQVGHDALKSIEFPWPVARIILQHHERMDGSGFPEGLSGEAILLEARVLAVADVVEAMSSHRPYRPAHGVEKALEEISQKKGLLYDSRVVEACLTLFAEKRFQLA